MSTPTEPLSPTSPAPQEHNSTPPTAGTLREPTENTAHKVSWRSHLSRGWCALVRKSDAVADTISSLLPGRQPTPAKDSHAELPHLSKTVHQRSPVRSFAHAIAELFRPLWRGGRSGNSEMELVDLSGSTDMSPPAVRGPSERFSQEELKKVFEETRETAPAKDDENTQIRLAMNITLFDDAPKGPWPKRQYITQYSVSPMDSLSAARELNKGRSPDDPQPLVLSFADAKRPGGGVEEGARTQEAELMRCTDYSYALFPEDCPHLAAVMKERWKTDSWTSYRIPETGAILTKGISVVRASGSEEYALLAPEDRWTVDIIASAAYDKKDLDNTTIQIPDNISLEPEVVHRLTRNEIEKKIKHKIRTQLAIAAKNGSKDLVLGAWGCGRLGNSPETISLLYKQVLELEFPGVFRNIVFAIPDATSENFIQFNERFQSRAHAQPEHGPAKADGEPIPS